MSPTYKKIKIRHLTNRAESGELGKKPREVITIENFPNQAHGAYLKPYKALLSLQTSPGL